MVSSINLLKPVPAFAATSNADQVNVTGDGTSYTILFPDEIFDNDNNFASPNFTAPVVGKYIFGICLQLDGITAAMNNALFTISIGASGGYRLLQCSYVPGQDVAGRIAYSWTVSAYLNALDTAHVSMVIQGGAKVVSVLGSTGLAPQRNPYFWGYLVSEV